MMSRVLVSTLALLACASTVLGAAIPAETLEKRDVFVPPVLYPHKGTVWTKGQRHNVTWYVSVLPVPS